MTSTALALTGLLAIPVGAAGATGAEQAAHQPAAATPTVTGNGWGARDGAGEIALSLTPAHPHAIAALAGATGVAPNLRRALLDRSHAPASAAAQVEAWAAANGFRALPDGADTVLLRGDAASLAAAFGTSLRTTGGRTTPTSALAVPFALAGVVSTADGLDTRTVVHARVTSAASSKTPADLASAYDASGLATAGAGVTVASVQFQDWKPADAKTFATDNDITEPSITTDYVETPASYSTDPDADGNYNAETALDVDAIMAAAPAASQIVYESNGDASGSEALYAQLASDAAAGRFQVLTTSWGSCESETSDASVIEGDLAQISAAGVTILAASGDSGAYDCYDFAGHRGSAAVDFPASSPSVIGVGGTSLTGSTAGGWAESGWGTGVDAQGNYAGDGSGGGISTLWQRPGYQANLTASPGTRRLVPDLSADADPATGLSSYATGYGSETVGGTSLASPLLAGYLAATLAASPSCTASSCPGLGDIHAKLYAAPATAFRDVTSGTNHLYNAGTGYDLVTGLGTPQLALLAPYLTATTAPTPTTTPTPTPTTGTTAAPSRAPIAPVGTVTANPTVPTAAVAVPLDTTAPTGSVTGSLVSANRAPSVIRLHANEAVTWRVTVTRRGTNAVVAGPLTTAAASIALTLPAGSYQVAATPTDLAGNVGATSSSQWSVPTDSFTRTGHWTVVRSAAAFGGTLLQTTAKGTTAKTTVYGSGITVTYLCQPGGGQLRLTLDGRVKATVATSCRKATYKTVTISHLPAKNHTVLITSLNGKNSLDDVTGR